MFDVFEVHKSRKVFTKPTYTPENRKMYSTQVDTCNFKHRYVEKDTLFQPAAFESNSRINISDLIIIQHTIDSSFENPEIDLMLLSQLNTLKAFEIFKIKKADHDTYTIQLDYVTHSSFIGIPKRENHKIFDLKQSQPMRYKLNGKSDFTMTRGKERTFHEFYYIIEWTGTAKNIEFLDKIEPIKGTNPVQKDLKMIDERKMLR